MSPDQKRSGRIMELTRMALNGAPLDKIRVRAYQMAAKATADQYVAEVVRRMQTLKERQK